MEKFFGRTYETVGNVSGDLLLKTRGGVKVQIGSSFIDLIKNGKINADIDIIKEASSKDNIIDNGLYIVKNVLYVKYQDTVLPLSSSTVENQVSYLPQLNITYEQQIQAQKNIGIYYDTLEEAQQNINDGYVYIKGKGLYIIQSSIPIQITNNNQFSSLNIGLDQYTEGITNYSKNHDFKINNTKLLKLSENSISCEEPLYISKLQDINNSFYITSSGGKSTLRINNVIADTISASSSNNLDNLQYYYNYNNIVTDIIDNSVSIDNTDNSINSESLYYTLYLKYSINNYQVGDYLYFNIYDENSSQNVEYLTTIVELSGTSVKVQCDKDIPTLTYQPICYYKYKDPAIYGFTTNYKKFIYSNNTYSVIIGDISEKYSNNSLTNGFYSDCAVTKNQILISPNLDNPNLTNIVFKKSDNFPKLEEGWELPNEDNSQKLATTKWVNSTKYTLPIATSNILGGIIVGDGLSITSTGILSVTDSWTDILNTISNNVSTNTNDITTLKSQVANLQKVVQDLQNKLKS